MRPLLVYRCSLGALLAFRPLLRVPDSDGSLAGGDATTRGSPPYIPQYSPPPIRAPDTFEPSTSVAADVAGAGCFDDVQTEEGIEASTGDDAVFAGQREAALDALVSARDAAHG